MPPTTSRKRYEAFRESRRVAPASSPAPAPARPSSARRYAGWLRPHSGQLALLFGASLLGIAIDMVWPLVSAHLIDEVIMSPRLTAAQKTAELVGFGLGMAGLFLLGSGLSWSRSLRQQLVSSRLSFQLRASLFHRVLRLPMRDLAT